MAKSTDRTDLNRDELASSLTLTDIAHQAVESGRDFWEMLSAAGSDRVHA